jgi:hypothetical protein
MRAALRRTEAFKLPAGKPVKGKDSPHNPAEIESLVGIFRGWVSGLGLSSEMMLHNLLFRLKGIAGRVQPGWIGPQETQRWQSREGMTYGEVIAGSQPRSTMPDDRRETGRYLSYRMVHELELAPDTRSGNQAQGCGCGRVEPPS